MSGGGKGGSQTTQASVPQWLEDPARRNIERAEEISQIGYVPYSGPEVAAFTPSQVTAMNNNASMAGAYGRAGGGFTMPEPTQFAGGVQGYSSLPLYEQSIANLQQSRPGQYDAIMGQFIDPFTGAPPTGAAMTTEQRAEAPFVPDYGGAGDHGYGGGVSAPGVGIGGYTGIGDMFDGGGAGASGSTFQGGGMVSGLGNAAGGPGGGGKA